MTTIYEKTNIGAEWPEFGENINVHRGVYQVYVFGLSRAAELGSMNRIIRRQPKGLLQAVSSFSSMPASSQGKTRPKAVIFDMGGVIIPSPLPIFKEFEERHGFFAQEITKLILTGNGSGTN